MKVLQEMNSFVQYKKFSGSSQTFCAFQIKSMSSFLLHNLNLKLPSFLLFFRLIENLSNANNYCDSLDIFYVDILVTLQDDFHFIGHFRLCFFYCEILFVIYILHLSLFG